MIPTDRQDSGLAVVEWVLLITGIVVPLVVLVMEIMTMIMKYYSVTSWSVSLPFP